MKKKHIIPEEKLIEALRIVFDKGLKCNSLHPDDDSYDDMHFQAVFKRIYKTFPAVEEKPSDRWIKVRSKYLNRSVILNDDCGCETCGFYEKEFTQHGFHGASWVIDVRFYCSGCNKELKKMQNEI